MDIGHTVKYQLIGGVPDIINPIEQVGGYIIWNLVHDSLRVVRRSFAFTNQLRWK